MLLAEEQSQHNGRKQEDGEEKHEDIEAHRFSRSFLQRNGHYEL
jgi:hypothetical protein